MNPNKTAEILLEFDRRLAGLCAEMRSRVGAVQMASSLVVHTARMCADLGEDFDEVAFEKWRGCVKEYRALQKNMAAGQEAANDDKKPEPV